MLDNRAIVTDDRSCPDTAAGRTEGRSSGQSGPRRAPRVSGWPAGSERRSCELSSSGGGLVVSFICGAGKEVGKAELGFGEGVCWELGLSRAEVSGLLKRMRSLEAEGMGCNQEPILLLTPADLPSPRSLTPLALSSVSLVEKQSVCVCVSDSGGQGAPHTEWVRCSGQPGPGVRGRGAPCLAG